MRSSLTSSSTSPVFIAGLAAERFCRRAAGGDDIFAADAGRFLPDIRRAGVVDQQLDLAAAVAQGDEDQAAEVALAVAPAHQDQFLADGIQVVFPHSGWFV